MEGYRIKDVVVRTYDGHSIRMEIDGIFTGSRLQTEDAILAKMRKIVKNDIPVAV